VRAYVYPLREHPLAPVAEVCIISTDVTDLKRAEEKNWQYNQELQILLETSRESSKHLELQRTLEQFTDQTKTLLNADNGGIYFLEKDSKTLRPALAVGPLSDKIEATSLKLDQGLIGAGVTTGQAQMLNYTNRLDQGSQLEPPYADNQHILFAPLTALNGMIGVMVISRKTKTPFTEDDLRFFESLVEQGSSAINNARLFEETHRNLNELATLYEASATISTIWNTQTVLNTLIRQMVYAINMNWGHIASWQKTRNRAVIQAEFCGDESAGGDKPLSGDAFSLTERPALLIALNQQRPVVLQRSNPLLDEAERKNMEKQGCRSILLVPLVVKGETIGWTELCENRGERVFTADEVRLARALANQVAVALENAQYLQQTQQTLEETTALYQVASALASTQDPQTIMSTVLREYSHVLDLKQGSVIIFDFKKRRSEVRVSLQDDTVSPQTSNGHGVSLEGQHISLENNAIYTQLMRTHRAVKVEDLPAARLTPQQAAALGGWVRPNALSALIIPIQIREEIVGVLVVEATQAKRVFDEREISLGQTMADQLGLALQNAQLYEAEYKRRQQAETLREVSAAVSSSLNLNEVLKLIMDQLGRVVTYNQAAIHLIEGHRRRIIAARGFAQPEQVIGLTFPVKFNPRQPESVVIHNREPLVMENVSEAYELFGSLAYNIKSWLGIPLIARDKVIGLISIGHAEASAYQEEDVQLTMAFANQVAVALENARLYELEVHELEKELEVAHDIQETLLPQFVPQVPGLLISGRSLPARQIGGDFFHFFSIGADQLGVAIGDVSGKGIPAALYMAAAITAIDTKINDGLAPAELLNHLNRTLYNRLRENKMNIGLQIATFIPLASPNSQAEEARGSLVTVSSGGMIAPIGATVHGCRFLPVSGFPIGSFSPDQLYHEDMFLLDPFTTIIFTSDGIVEAQNKNGELFGFDRLEAAINDIISTRDAETIAEHLIQSAQDFMDGAEQMDDMTVVVVVKT
jgi:sigma-B regulation protein RsbU (phosphoserine phosphatase)